MDLLPEDTTRFILVDSTSAPVSMDALEVDYDKILETYQKKYNDAVTNIRDLNDLNDGIVISIREEKERRQRLINKRKLEKMEAIMKNLISAHKLQQKIISLEQIFNNKSIPKQRRDHAKININYRISKFNKTISFLISHGFDTLKPIGTTPRKNPASKHHIKEEISKGLDTSIGDVDPSYNIIKICGSRRHAHTVQRENITKFIDRYIELPNGIKYETVNKKLVKFINSDSNFIVRKSFDGKSLVVTLCIKCEVNNCKKPIPVVNLLQYLPNEDLLKYIMILKKIHIKLFINENGPEYADYCTNKECRLSEYGFEVSKDEINKNIRTCTECKTTFCRQCRMTPYHSTKRCEGKSIDADPETIELLKRKTRPCPKCNIRVEKIYGCDKIPCTNCKKFFCWRCLMILDDVDPYLHRQNCDANLNDPIDPNFR